MDQSSDQILSTSISSTPSTPIAPIVVTPISETSASVALSSLNKPSPSVWFTSEIQQMMHGFGDCRKPLAESALLIEQIVHQQLVTALYKAEEVARQRSARFIGIEDFLFLLRKDKVKLRRLIKYMELKDIKKGVFKSSADDDMDNSEYDGRPQPKKRKKICYDFLSNIDQTGELVSIFEDDNFFDEIKHERALRAELMSRGMDAQQYLDFCTARQTSFIARYKSQRFKDWLMQGVTVDVKPNPLAVETLSYLAYETVAQIMDLSLIVKRDMNAQSGDPMSKVIPQVMVNYDAFQGTKHQMLPPQSSTTATSGSLGGSIGAASSLKSPPSVPSSPLNSPPSTPTTPSTNTLGSSLGASGGSARTKNMSKKKKKAGWSGSKDIDSSSAITVAHIREAMRRYGQNLPPFADFSKTYAKISKQRLLCA